MLRIQPCFFWACPGCSDRLMILTTPVPWLPGSLTRLTPMQEERLQDLKERCQVLFDASKPQHMVRCCLAPQRFPMHPC